MEAAGVAGCAAAGFGPRLDGRCGLRRTGRCGRGRGGGRRSACAAAGAAGRTRTGPGARGCAGGRLRGGRAGAGPGLRGSFERSGWPARTILVRGNDSRSRRATGASTVDDADFTNSPCSLSVASSSLLVTPSSFANSCTRALPATALLTERSSEAVPRPHSGVGSPHDLGLSPMDVHRWYFTVCS